jgi:hypothetical protein
MRASPVVGHGVSLADTLIMSGFSVVLQVIAWAGFTLRRWERPLLLALHGGCLWPAS